MYGEPEDASTTCTTDGSLIASCSSVSADMSMERFAMAGPGGSCGGSGNSGGGGELLLQLPAGGGVNDELQARGDEHGSGKQQN